MDAARIVDHLEIEIDAELRDLLTRVGQWARERVRAADDDLAVGHAGLGGRPARAQQDDQQEEADRAGDHARSPCRGCTFCRALAIPPGMNSMEAIRMAPKISGR